MMSIHSPLQRLSVLELEQDWHIIGFIKTKLHSVSSFSIYLAWKICGSLIWLILDVSNFIIFLSQNTFAMFLVVIIQHFCKSGYLWIPYLVP